MAFSDILYLVVGAIGFLITLAVCMAVFTPFMAAVGPNMPGNTSTQVSGVWTGNISFFDSSFAAIFVIMAVMSIGFTLFLNSHPVFLVIWLFANLLTLFVWDVMMDVLTDVITALGVVASFPNSVAFLQNDMAQAIVVINVLLGVVLFGKKLAGGNL